MNLYGSWRTLKILTGVFWTKFEHFLSKTPNKEASPAVARKPRHPAKKFSLLFFCARRIFSSNKRNRKLFCWLLLLTEQAAGLASVFRSGAAEFPPTHPSDTPSRGRFFFSAEFKAVPISLTHHLNLPIIAVYFLYKSLPEYDKLKLLLINGKSGTILP